MADSKTDYELRAIPDAWQELGVDLKISLLDYVVRVSFRL
jgi:hypothetical protein